MPSTSGRFAVLATLAAVGCGGGPGPRASSGGAELDADVAPVADTAAADDVCPSSPPAEGASCPCAYSCEYGDDPDVRCDTLMTGAHGQWVVSVPPASTGCATGLAPGCPSSYADLSSSSSCSSVGAACEYPEARCTCASSCVTGTHVVGEQHLAGAVWCCPDALVSGTSCPSTRPRIGSACTVPDQACDYGACTGNVDVECLGGVWESVAKDCAP